MLTPLTTATGAYFTMPTAEAHRVLPRLREYLDCDGVSSWDPKSHTEYNWCQSQSVPEWCGLQLATKYHARALAFLAGWQAGSRDNADRFNDC